MDREAFTRRVTQAMEEIRDCLVSIEAAAQTEDRPPLHVLARGYAALLAPLRDYVASSSLGRPLPRALSRRLGEGVAALVDLEDEIRALGLHPDLDELAALMRDADAVT